MERLAKAHTHIEIIVIAELFWQISKRKNEIKQKTHAWVHYFRPSGKKPSVHFAGISDILKVAKKI